MKLAKNRKVLIAMAIVLALIVGASATFAWATSKNTLANEFSNEGFANGHGLVVNEPQEEFKFTIGETTTKEVNIVNTGESPMLARVSFEEMIKLLGDNGQITYENSDTLNSGMIRVPFNGSTAALAGWKTLAAAGIDATGVTIPASITVYKLDGGPMYKACCEYETGKFQLVKFDGKLNAAGDALTAATAQYAFYTEGTAKYNSWNLKHNYEPWNTEPLLGIKPADKDAGASTVNKDEITFIYASAFAGDLSDGLASYKNKWYYNPADGYFYYLGVLAGGNSTPKLLEGVRLEANANQDTWQKYEYTLVVVVEGLQATLSALTDTSIDPNSPAAGWMLNGTTNGNVLAALTAVINDFNA